MNEQIATVRDQLLRAQCFLTLTPIAMGDLRFGRTYEARLKKETASWRLLLRFFTGEEEVVSPGHPAPLINVTEDLRSNAKNLVVDMKTPW